MRLASIAVIIGFALPAASAYSDSPPVIVTATPQSLDLCPGGEGQALVVVQNNGQTHIRNACLTFFSNGPVEAAFPASTPVIADDPANSLESCKGIAMPPLPEGGAFSTLVNVKLTKHPVTGAALYFRAKYQFGKPPSGDPATAVGTLDVRGPAMPSADAIKVEAKVGFASLHENEAGRVVLTITNGTNDTLTLSKPMASKLPHADVTGPGDSGAASNAAADNGKPKLEAPSAISPQSAVAIDSTITANPRILPGKYIGLIDVDAQTSCGVSLHRVAAYEVTLGVFGQSELLTTIGVPSLLFLPGFLVLTLWMLIWRLGLQASFLAKDGEFFVGAKEPEFWLLGITFSLLMFVCARNLPGLGYQRPYELSDIASLWGVSLGVGLISYMLIFGVARWRDSREKKRVAAEEAKLSEAKAQADKDKAARTLTSNDDVITALKRMKLRGFEIRNRQKVKSTGTANPFNGFLLWPENNGETFWVIPPIQCRKLKDELDKLDPAGKTDDTARLYEALTKAQELGLAKVDWMKKGNLNWPTEMKPSEFSYADDETIDLVVVTEGN